MRMSLNNIDYFEQLSYATNVSNSATDFTHPLYKYPAALSPYIARSVISNFSRPGETVFDPFCGGGTTAIEAITQGRRALCSDLNPLACFITRAKSTPIRKSQINELKAWINKNTPLDVKLKYSPSPLITRSGNKYLPSTFGLFLALKKTADSISNPGVKRLATLIVLKTGQVCFDCQQNRISTHFLSRTFHRIAQSTISRISEYSQHCRSLDSYPKHKNRLRVINSDASKIPSRIQDEIKNISLVLTSPPYPGVHVLYHRWQFRGRKEISLPYSITGLNDGAGESFYTLGSRHDPLNKEYFLRTHRIFSNLNIHLSPGTYIAQVIAFPNPNYQLKKYLNTMSSAGLVQFDISDTRKAVFKRNIPNRKWYIRTGAVKSSMNEYLLIHKTTGTTTTKH